MTRDKGNFSFDNWSDIITSGDTFYNKLHTCLDYKTHTIFWYMPRQTLISWKESYVSASYIRERTNISLQKELTRKEYTRQYCLIIAKRTSIYSILCSSNSKVLLQHTWYLLILSWLHCKKQKSTHLVFHPIHLSFLLLKLSVTVAFLLDNSHRKKWYFSNFISISLQAFKSWDHILRRPNFVMKRSFSTLSVGTIYQYLSFLEAKTSISLSIPILPARNISFHKFHFIISFWCDLNLKKTIWQGFIDKSKWKKELEAVVSTRLFRKSFAQSGLNPRSGPNPQSDLQTPGWTLLLDKAFNPQLCLHFPDFHPQWDLNPRAGY